MTIQSFIIRKAANLRYWFKKRQYDAKVAKHKVRMELYRVVQLELKKFVNWSYSKASKETRREIDKWAVESSRPLGRGYDLPIADVRNK